MYDVLRFLHPLHNISRNERDDVFLFSKKKIDFAIKNIYIICCISFADSN